MFKRSPIFAFMSLIALAFLGAWLTGMFEAEKKAEDIAESSLLLGFLGLCIFLGAVIGILLLIRQNLPPMSQSEMLGWEAIRSRGKRRYVRSALVKGFLLGVGGILWPLVSNYTNAKSAGDMIGNLWIYVALFLVTVGGACYAAIRTWNANEQAFNDLAQSTAQPKTSLQPKLQ